MRLSNETMCLILAALGQEASVCATGEKEWGNPFGDDEQPVPETGWRTTALAEGRRLWFQMCVVRAQPDALPSAELDEATEAVYRHLVAVNAAVRNQDSRWWPRRVLTSVRQAVTSSRVDSATSNLHAADVVVSRYLQEQDLVARLPRLISQVEKAFLPEDPRRIEVVQRLSP